MKIPWVRGRFRDPRKIGAGISRRTTSGVFGHVDIVSQEGVRGWLVDFEHPDGVPSVSVFLDGLCLGNAICNRFRQDIGDILGSHADAGFVLHWGECELPSDLAAEPRDRECVIEVKATSSDRLVAGTPARRLLGDICAWIESERGRYKRRHRGKGYPPVTPQDVAAFVERLPGQRVEPEARLGDVRLIAFYLPQFHPIMENDEWWGPGFTEWTNVAQARPYFKDHYQPHVPGELGFYDLRLPEVREAQARLAQEHGIYGFCYYYYWFAGRRILDRPLRQMVESGEPDFPFCICWANENWSRRWDGSESEVLLEQVHNEETDADFIREVLPLFRDRRYIRLNGAPLLLVYRVSLLPDPAGTAARWRRTCARHGIEEIHLCMAETFGLTEPRQYGFDSSVQFPPHNAVAKVANDRVEGLVDGFSGMLYDYGEVVTDQISRTFPAYKRFPGVMTSWDNTARRKTAGNVFINATPDQYEIWLRHAIDQARECLPAGERLVFINAWNEWAEGAHLEPDRKNGRRLLESTRRALGGQSDWRLVLQYAHARPLLSGAAKDDLVSDLRFALERLSRVNAWLLGVMGQYGLPKGWTVMKPGLPASLREVALDLGGDGYVDQINNHMNPGSGWAAVDAAQKLYLCGWCTALPHRLARHTPTYLVLSDSVGGGSTYYAFFGERIDRPDVAAKFKGHKADLVRCCGFKGLIDVSRVPAGLYRMAIVSRFPNHAVMTKFEAEVEIG